MTCSSGAAETIPSTAGPASTSRSIRRPRVPRPVPASPSIWRPVRSPEIRHRTDTLISIEIRSRHQLRRHLLGTGTQAALVSHPANQQQRPNGTGVLQRIRGHGRQRHHHRQRQHPHRLPQRGGGVTVDLGARQARRPATLPSAPTRSPASTRFSGSSFDDTISGSNNAAHHRDVRRLGRQRLHRRPRRLRPGDLQQQST